MSVIFGMNANTLNTLIDSNNKHTGIDIGNSTTYIDLNILTSDDKRLTYKLMKLFIKLKRVSTIKEGFNEYKLNNKSVISYKLGSDMFAFSKEEKKELLSDDRYSHCYLKSIENAPYIKNSNVLLGLTKIGDYTRMHAVVEFSIKNKLFVFDWTQNIVMPKDQYIKLFDFNIYNSISGSDVRRIVELCTFMGINTASSILLAFGKELENDINKRIMKK